MQKLTKDSMTKGPKLCPPTREPASPRLCGGDVKSLWVLLMASMMMLSACRGGGGSSDPQQSATLSGNWQFMMTNPDTDLTIPQGTLYGLQGGFLLQNNGSVTGQAVYSLSGVSQSNGIWSICDSGSAQITGTVSGQTVNLAAAAGSQTFVLRGTLGSNGQIANATFTTTGGIATGFSSCGMPTPAGGLPWSATSVPPLTGSITGSFHSYNISPSGLYNQDYPVTGSFSQGQNIGASSATVTGTLSFIDPTSLVSDYPCIPAGTISVNGQISGNNVVLQLIGVDGSDSGQIGVPTSQAGLNGFQPVTFQSSAPGGYVLNSTGLGYAVNTKSCPNPNNSGGNSEDVGYLCLALNGSTACQQPITLIPASLTFPPQMLVACADTTCLQVIQGTPTIQTVTLTNNSNNELDGLSLDFSAQPSDFNPLPSFAVSDTCLASAGSTNFNLRAGQSCTLTISFAPQQSCSWLPNQGGTPPVQCPDSRTATLTVNSPSSADNDLSFAVPVKGTGISYIQPSSGELDFGAEAISEASLPQLLSFTNYGPNPVQIFGPRNLSAYPCQFLVQQSLQLPLTLMDYQSGNVAGVQVVAYGGGASINVSTGVASYNCDVDPDTGLSNFQITSDTCTGVTLFPQASCSLDIAFVPQKGTYENINLDYFLELNTLTCTSTQTTGCEVDSGRFPVELKANAPSPLRMLPAAGLNFGVQAVNKSSGQQAITLFNDPGDPNSATVNLTSKIEVSGSYSETDDCPVNLAPGSACTLGITFNPTSKGLNQGKLTIFYTLGSGGSGNPQFVYLQGTGQ
ncbi:MAG: choice-of-anchor D domain-containing protein [Terriglobales bacterium]